MKTWLAMIASVMCLWLPCAAQEPQPPEGRIVLTPEQMKAIENGLKALAKQQAEDGSIHATTGLVGTTSIAGLAFLASGSTPADGPYRANITSAVNFVLAADKGTGYLAIDKMGNMYDHAFATIFLAQARLSSDDKALRNKLGQALTAAVKVIEQAQNDRGGWRYQPKPGDDDVSVSSCLLLALKAAQQAGTEVNRKTIDKARQYIHGCQDVDGGFRYIPAQGGSAWPRSAAATAVLGHFGPLDSNAHEKALTFIHEHAFRPGGNASFLMYGSFFYLQAMSHAGAEDWDGGAARLLEQIAKRQREDGTWAGEGDVSTALALTVLQLPGGRLTSLAWKPQPEWEKDVAAPADEKAMAKLWDDLAREDTAGVWKAQASLTAGGAKTVAFVRNKLAPAVPADGKLIAKLIAALDADDFKTRQKAQDELKGIGSAAKEQLKSALGNTKSQEVRQRAAELLELLDNKSLPPANVRQAARAIRVLQRIGGDEAAAVLTRLAGGHQGDLQTEIAKDALSPPAKATSRPADRL